jgi:hypothetical protein
MARAPRAKVSVTSGQGVSRRAYKQVYDMGGGARVKGEFSAGTSREYSKGKPKKEKYPSGINVSYGDTYHPSVEEMKKPKKAK